MAKSSYDANHCPLCHKNIDPGDEGWKKHLMEESGCAFNSRRKKNNSKKSNLQLLIFYFCTMHSRKGQSYLTLHFDAVPQ